MQKYFSKNQLGVIAFILFAVCGFVSFFLVFAIADNERKMPSENEDCLMCHDDKSLTGTIDGKEKSVHVDPKTQLNSVHYAAKCTDCHTDLAGKDLPHEDDLKKATCGKCHTAEQRDYDISKHGVSNKSGDPLTPTCNTCHGSHNIKPKSAPNSAVSPLKIPFLCGKCHKEGTKVQLQRNIPQAHILENYTQSIHGEGLLKKGLTVTANCASCHTPHLILPHTDSRSSIARKNIASTCTKCHSQIEAVHQKIIDGKRWEKEEKVLPACVDCHQPHKARKAYYDMGLSNKECMNCHSNQSLKSKEDGRSMFVDQSKLNTSVHNDMACSKCHTEVSPSKNSRSCSTITQGVNCGSCHENVNDKYMKSRHGRFYALGDKDAPKCTTCHGDHQVFKNNDPRSDVFSVNIPQLCSKCHQDGEKAAKRLKGQIKNVVNNYTESVHGQRLTSGTLTTTADCSDCHTAHSESNHTDTTSSTHKSKISSTCGQCHYGITKDFNKSIHSTLVSKKSKETLPVCNDCHPAHTILDPTKDEFRFSIMSTCGKCHEEISHSYFDTYHGKASILGSSNSAKCHDCHSAHAILPPGNPESILSRNNIIGTCANCHPDANKGFTRYLTHATHHDPVKYPFLFITFWGMTLLLLGTFTVSWLHTLLWLPKSLKVRKQIKLLKAEGHSGTRIRRFSVLDRILHVIMIISFLTLAATGMALKFSYTSWALLFINLIGGVEVAGVFHRIAALALFGVFFAHVYDLIANKRKQFNSWKEFIFGPESMLPRRKDLTDFVGSIKWFIGKGPRPNYGKWTYWEKFDYYAVFWGIFVIGFTGLTLWFPEFFTQFLPGEFINIATIVHSDEALLAAGFIFTIHFFNTHFRPEKFPMDTVVFSGSYDLEEFKFDRPEEYERAVERGKLENMIVEPPNESFRKLFKTFGWIALTIGLIIVFLIVISIIDQIL